MKVYNRKSGGRRIYEGDYSPGRALWVEGEDGRRVEHTMRNGVLVPVPDRAATGAAKKIGKTERLRNSHGFVGTPLWG